jgi:hypothetical protein
MRSFDNLEFYCIPPLPESWTSPSPTLSMQLGLWSGQLYLPDYEMYERLCAFLGLYTPSCQSIGDFPIQIDGFIKPHHRAGLPPSTFKKSPVPFLKEFVSLRQKGMGFSLTHMGQILLGRSLTKEDFNN